MTTYVSEKERFVGGALVKAGAPFELAEGQKPSDDMTKQGEQVEAKPAKPAKQKAEADTLSKLAEVTKADPVP